MFIFPHIETSNCVFDSWLQTVILISKLDFYSVRASPASVSQLICTHQFSAASICKLVGNPIDYCVLNYWIFFIFTKHNRLRFVYSARSNIQGLGHGIYLMMNMEMKLRCNSFGINDILLTDWQNLSIRTVCSFWCTLFAFELNGNNYSTAEIQQNIIWLFCAKWICYQRFLIGVF